MKYAQPVAASLRRTSTPLPRPLPSLLSAVLSRHLISSFLVSFHCRIAFLAHFPETSSPSLSSVADPDVFVLTAFIRPLLLDSSSLTYFGPFCFRFLSLKSKPMTIMSLKWSEHFEFNMCENIWIQRREHSAVLSFPGKCCCSRWDQTFTPPHLSASPAPSVPLVSHEHRNDF